MKKLRHRTASSNPLAVIWLVVLLAWPAVAAAQSGFTGIVVFGTSLSDPGNAFALRGEALVPADYSLNPLLIPAAPYARGGHHFSDGATWVEQLGLSVGLGGSVRPAFTSSAAGAANFAVGAARAYEDGINFNLPGQVNAFLERSGGAARPDALYVIEMGSNDVRDAFALYATGGNGGPILQAAVTSTFVQIQVLYAAGAREFLVWNVPNIALTPALRTLGPAAGALATQLTQAFNAALTQGLAQLSGLPGMSFTRLDAFGLLNAINANPSAFGLTNVTTACVTPNVPPFKCEAPDEFLFWDGIHPSRSGHAILAQAAAAVLPH